MKEDVKNDLDMSVRLGILEKLDTQANHDHWLANMIIVPKKRVNLDGSLIFQDLIVSVKDHMRAPCTLIECQQQYQSPNREIVSIFCPSMPGMTIILSP